MSDRLARIRMMTGEAALNALASLCVAVVGLGGVGGFSCEALARSGVGHFILVDGDKVEESNINRQLAADYSTIGEYKTTIMKRRILLVSPDAQVDEYPIFISDATEFPLEKVDSVIDAIDDVEAKIALIKRCHEFNIPIISAMGAGNRLYSNQFEITEIQKTTTDPLARKMRRRLREEEIDYPVRCVSSREKPRYTGSTPASLMTAAGGAGLLLASAILEQFISESTVN